MFGLGLKPLRVILRRFFCYVRKNDYVCLTFLPKLVTMLKILNRYRESSGFSYLYPF